jgi:alkylation response protein AidB-like acyl-CoA dehydrogenase
MKERGVLEVRAALARMRRAHALGRVSSADLGYVEKRLLEVEAKIIAMREIDETGEEV